ncbi:DsrE family protein [Paradesulfitobacterium ferrireducens]|uniref:DsrE family protein n=1 Tax=Paradesulfitobacterium ferrireducens TaxID=2816476 RepID=UPI001A8C3701|nr:DsrE family protein [Paradesulfitobacterium ferrireducens]
MASFADKMLIFKSEGIGEGDPGLARKMMKGFLKMLSKETVKPKSIFFLGESVRLLLKESQVLEYLQALEQEGVDLLVCRAAVEWYDLEQKLQAGRVISTGHWLKYMQEYETITL